MTLVTICDNAIDVCDILKSARCTLGIGSMSSYRSEEMVNRGRRWAGRMNL